jgi:hypothetical protein
MISAFSYLLRESVPKHKLLDHITHAIMTSSHSTRQDYAAPMKSAMVRD